LATTSAPTVNADPKTTNTAIRAMLPIADSPGGKALEKLAFRNIEHYQALFDKSVTAMLRGRQEGRRQGASSLKVR
jgi:hypothetical protein